MKKLLFILPLVICQFTNAQIAEVVSIKQIPMEKGSYHFPTISPQGDYVLISSTGYNGLVKIDLTSYETKILSTAPSAGYYPTISADGKKIAFYEAFYKNNRRYTSVKSLDLSTPLLSRAIEEAVPSRNITGIKITNGSLKIATAGKESQKKLTTDTEENTIPLLTIENKLMVIYKADKRIELAPNGDDKSYYWASISPDGKKIVYNTAYPTNTWICDINGKNPIALGRIGAPQWIGNNHIIGMNDKDDNSKITSSSIEIIDIKSKIRQNLTPSNIIATYPSASADCKTIAFDSPQGNVYIMNINLK